MLDNGAFTLWRQGGASQWHRYYAWVDQWLAYHTTWAVIPDVIDGDDSDNDALLAQWPHRHRGAPVWHMHESIDRLRRLCDTYPRVCIGSSGQYATVGSPDWRRRMDAAMNAVCTPRSPAWLHMLRGMQCCSWGYPFASVDSTDIARNHNRGVPARVMAERWNSQQCPAVWTPRAEQLSLIGVA